MPTDPCAVFKCPQVCGFDCPPRQRPSSTGSFITARYSRSPARATDSAAAGNPPRPPNCPRGSILPCRYGFNSQAPFPAWALEDALLRRFGVLPDRDIGVVLRTDNALVYASVLYRRLARRYGLQQEFILPHTPEQNGVAESFMGTLKIECIWQHRFATYDEAKTAINAYIRHYNETRPHSSLGYLTPIAWRERQAN